MNSLPAGNPLNTGQAPASGQVPLPQLRDIHLPDPIGVWPPAPGWWLLGALIIIAAVFIGCWLYRRHQRDAYRKEALGLLEKATREFENKLKKSVNISTQPTELKQFYFFNLCELLKRTALTAYGTGMSFNGSRITGLSGKDWITFLFDSCETLSKPNSREKSLTSDQVALIYQQLYSPAPEALENIDVQRMQYFCRTWITKHQSTPPQMTHEQRGVANADI